MYRGGGSIIILKCMYYRSFTLKTHTDKYLTLNVLVDYFLAWHIKFTLVIWRKCSFKPIMFKSVCIKLNTEFYRLCREYKKIVNKSFSKMYNIFNNVRKSIYSDFVMTWHKRETFNNFILLVICGINDWQRGGISIITVGSANCWDEHLLF